MAQLDALALVKQLRARLVDFGVAEAFTADTNLSSAMRSIWEKPCVDGLVGDIWIEASRASKSSGKTLRQVVTDGLFDHVLAEHLADVDVMPDEIKLYQHQLESIQAAAQSAPETRPAIGVTAGTGGGKTESFLLPILSQLYTTPRRAPSGIRALILYPMNALVNDQVERLESWLAGQSRVSFFHFTSETPEDKKRADAEGLPPAAPHRFRTRQQARGKEDETGKTASGGPQPDVLVTNFSMLEYMLCRPQDAVFFSSALEAIVIDEAHLYSGTLAAEIMLLLRRLMLRCDVRSDQVLQIATSATLGGTKDELADFIATLFSKPVERTQIIQGEFAEFDLQPVTPSSPTPDPQRIAEQEWLPSGTITIERGEQELLVDARMATTQLLRLAASARPRVDRLPVLPHRLHLQVRAPTSLSVCLFPGCDHDESPQLSPLGSVTSNSGGKCVGCESPTYPIVRCGNCGCWGVAAVLHRNKLLPASPTDLSPGLSHRILIPVENVEGQKPGTLHVIDPSDGNCAVSQGVHLLEVDYCPRCDEPVRDRGYRWLSTVDSLALSIATETLLAELSPMPRGKSWRPAEGRRLLTFSDSRQAAARLGPRLQNQHETQMFRAMLAQQADVAFQQKSRREFLERDIQAKKAQVEEPGVGEEERDYIREQLQDMNRRLEQMIAGGTIAEWQTKLEANSLMAQFLDPDVADKQPQFKDPQTGKRSWDQRDWDKNRDEVRRRLPFLLAAELARRPRSQPSAETVGIVTVTYPGIERLRPDHGFLGLLSAEAAANLELCYSDLCHLVCDAIRAQGCVNLGSSELHREFASYRPPVGRWMSLRDSSRQLETLVGQSKQQINVDFAARVLIAARVNEDDAERLGMELLETIFQSISSSPRSKSRRRG